jgi:hypothetical protein
MKKLTSILTAVALACALCIATPLSALAVGEPENTDPYANAAPTSLKDGEYTIDIAFEGGSGKAQVNSPATLTAKGGKAVVKLEWSSSNYDYMVVAGEKYLPTNKSGNSTFVIPVTAYNTPVQVVGDTIAMSTPHEITYTLTFNDTTIEPVGKLPLVPMIVAAVVLAVFSAVAWILKSRKEEREMALNHELSDEEQR